MNYKYLGLLAFALLVGGLTLVLWRWPQGRHKTFSQHVALRRSSIIFYCMLFIVVLPILTVFFIEWFTPHFGITVWFNGLFLFAAICQLACTFIPEGVGWASVWHRRWRACRR